MPLQSASEENRSMQTNAKLAVAMMLAQAVMLPADSVAAHADALSDWTAHAQAIATEQRELPLSRARTLAILHVAVFEALEAADRGGLGHQPGPLTDRDILREAAAAAAAHDVLVALYPDRAPDLSPALAALLAGMANRVAKARGYAIGKKAAAVVLARSVPAPRGKKGRGPQVGDLIGGSRP
jgi:hypothetical protein